MKTDAEVRLYMKERSKGRTQAQAVAALAAQGYRLFTPEGNRSSIVTYFTTTPAGTLTEAFARARIDVTVRAGAGQVRVSPALFNTRDDIAAFLEVTRQMA